MNPEQLTLATVSPAPAVDADAVQAFLAKLADGGWHTAAALGARTEQEKRVLRALRQAAAGQVISTDHGYKLRACATEADFDRAIARLRSMIREMARAQIELLRARHRAAQGRISSQHS